MTMLLRAGEPSEPFGPLFVMGNSRGAVPADFPRDALLRLLDWAIALVDPELRARFLDVLWVQAKAFKAAQGEIHAYLESAKRLELEHPEEWTPYVERLEHALRIASSLGKGGILLRDGVLAEIESAVIRYRGEDMSAFRASTGTLVALLDQLPRASPVIFSPAWTSPRESARRSRFILCLPFWTVGVVHDQAGRRNRRVKGAQYMAAVGVVIGLTLVMAILLRDLHPVAGAAGRAPLVKGGRDERLGSDGELH
jgi:hypothetical protein